MTGISRFLEELLHRDQERYRLVATLDGHEAPINTFSFNANGSLLASGGDDEAVKVWDMERFTCRQTLVDPAKQWGQVTAIKFIQLDNASLRSDWLCFGTGRGQFLIYRRSRKTTEYVECLGSRVFSTGDGVEAFAFDQFFQRIALTSHYGKVKMFRFEKGDLVELWSDELLDAIPRALIFTAKGQEICIYGMENGTVYTRDAETSNMKSTRVFKTPIGNISACPTTASVLLDNMRDGFDLYVPNRMAPISSFKVCSTRRYVKGCAFGEGGKIVVCGSDHGKVYVFGVHDEYLNQALVHGNRGQMIQAVQTATTEDHHLVVSGTCDGRFDIVVWRRPIRVRVGQGERKNVYSVLLVFNFLLLAFFAWMSQEFWYPPISEIVQRKKPSSIVTRPTPLLKDVETKQRLPTLDDILNTMDDATLRKLLGVPSPRFSDSDRQLENLGKKPDSTWVGEEGRPPPYDESRII